MRNYRYNLAGAVTGALIAELICWAAFVVGYFVLLKTIPGLRLQRPQMVWALAATPLLSVAFVVLIAWRNRALARFADNQLLATVLEPVSTARVVFSFICWRLALFLLCVALASPQSGSRLASVQARGIDLMIALDVSSSMNAQDIAPSRLERSKRAIQQVVDQLRGDRLGLVVFAGQAFVQLPITNDYNAAKLFLNTLSSDAVPVQGTAIGDAIERCTESFDLEKPVQRAIIVITDGENHEDDALEAAKNAAEQGIRIFTLGMGSPEGAPIPEGNRGYKKDKQGNVVVTRLNESMLKELAEVGGGIFVRASTAESGLNILMDEIDKIEKTDFGTIAYSDYESRFQPFLIAAFILVILGLLTGERKRTGWFSIKWTRT